MIKKQDLILKINKILNKLNKDKLINFYNIFINKKGGSLRNLCYHLNTTISDKEVRDKRAIITDRKIVIPQRYTLTPRNLLIEFIKDIIIITSILKKNMIDEYDNLKTRNQELKYKFVCYTYYMHDDIRKLDTNHFDLISYFMEFYLNKDKKKHTISKIGNSNRLRIKTDNGITIDVIYTKDYQRINLVMYLEEISEKKRKEYFDQFEECYYSPQQQFTTTNQFQFQPYTYEQQRPVVKTRILLDDTTLLSRVGQQQPQLKFGFTGLEKEIQDEIKIIEEYLNSFIKQTIDKKKYNSSYEDLKKHFEILVGINKKISDKSKHKTFDIDKLRKLYDSLYNTFINYLCSKYLYELNLIIDDDKKTKQEKLLYFESINSKIDLFQIDENIVEDNKIYLQFKEEKENFEKFLTDNKTYDDYEDDIDIELISLIVQYYITNFSGFSIKYKFYLALFKFIKNNYKLYKLYNELKEKYKQLNDIRDFVPRLFNTISQQLQTEYNRYNDDIIIILRNIGKLLNDLFGFKDPNLKPAIPDDDVSKFKDKIKTLMTVLKNKTYKYNKLLSTINLILSKINSGTLFTNDQD
jgi:hypothetical protein